MPTLVGWVGGYVVVWMELDVNDNGRLEDEAGRLRKVWARMLSCCLIRSPFGPILNTAIFLLWIQPAV